MGLDHLGEVFAFHVDELWCPLAVKRSSVFIEVHTDDAERVLIYPFFRCLRKLLEQLFELLGGH